MSELRQLLAVARAREQHALVEQIGAELRARPARSTQWGATAPRMDIDWIEDEPPPRPVRRRSLAVLLSAGAAGVVCAALVWGVSVPQSQAIAPIKASAPRAAMALTSVPMAADDQLSDPAPAGDPQPEAGSPAAAPGAHNPCYDLATAAERLICGYPSLAQKDQRLKAAYRAAIAGGADAAELEQAQAAWKAGAAEVSDRLVLADLYDKRIQELSGSAP
ncbi:hypothetical protein [Phenylobacterium sp.]|uniref:hypothetical protein n=1 Tax=Phenylobacterium sp. TaxID=1871053 RepID=UPI0025D400CA|nr:hypothetical protein [Phenylobacterium sp.]